MSKDNIVRMLHCSFFFLSLIFSFSTSFSLNASLKVDIIYARDLGIIPGTYRNLTPHFRQLLDSCKNCNDSTVIILEKGRYDLWPEGASRKEIYVSNTASEIESPSKIKIIGLHFEKLKNLQVQGNGAELIFHGSITPVAIDSCQNITLRQLTIDFERPAGSEMKYISVKPGEVIVKLHPDSHYDITDKHISLIGEGWRSNQIHCVKLSPSTDQFKYSTDYSVLSTSEVEEIEPGMLRFHTPKDFLPEVGSILTLRDIIRDQVGFLNLASRGTTLLDLNIRYMHGLGIISQYSHDIIMHRLDCSPSPLSGRIMASSADFTHFSGCSGLISIDSCNFSGSHDDAINIHGTNLRIIEKNNSDQSLELRFMHHQTFGFLPFSQGDTVAYVNPKTMLRIDTAVIVEAKLLNPRLVSVKVDRQLPDDLVLGSTCLENLSATPSVEISDCTFSRISTRGILLTTPRKAIIKNCRFENIGMAGILIEGDADNWFESGPVCDVTVIGNTFINCGFTGATNGATIAINPSNEIINPKNPVHSGIRFVHNLFSTDGRPVLTAKSVANLIFSDNTVTGDTDLEFIFNGCDDITISHNKMLQPHIIEINSKNINIQP